MTTALQDLLEYLNVEKESATALLKKDVIGKINSLMPKDRETALEIYRNGVGSDEECQFETDFPELFPTHPTNK